MIRKRDLLYVFAGVSAATAAQAQETGLHSINMNVNSVDSLTASGNINLTITPDIGGSNSGTTTGTTTDTGIGNLTFTVARTSGWQVNVSYSGDTPGGTLLQIGQGSSSNCSVGSANVNNVTLFSNGGNQAGSNTFLSNTGSGSGSGNNAQCSNIVQYTFSQTNSSTVQVGTFSGTVTFTLN